MNNLFVVFIGGGIGSICRYLVSKINLYYFSETLPFGTLLSNLLSCLVLAVTLLLLNPKEDSHMPLKLLIVTGFCGGFSTFSTFSQETFILMKQGNYLAAVLNVVLSVVLGIGIVFLFTKS